MEKKDYPYFDKEIRNKLEHETSVVNNRMMWHHAVQIALLIGYYHVYVSNKSDMSEPIWILTAFSVFGILLALSAIYSLWISDKARAFILMHWNRYLAEIGCDSDMFPPVSGDPLSCIRKCKENDATYRDMHLKKRDFKLK